MAINFIRGNILSDNLVRGSNLSFQSSSLSRDVLFVDVINGNVGINTTSSTHSLTVDGNCNILGPFAANSISAAGNISTGNFFIGNGSQLTGVAATTATALTNGTTNITTTLNGNANVTIGGTSNVAVFTTTGLLVTGLISASGNVTGGNIGTAGTVSATGNVDSGNVNTALVSVTGNVIAGNVSTGGAITATGNVTGGNVLSGGAISATGNVTGGNINTAGNISATGDILANNLSATGNIALANLTVANTTISTSLFPGNITLTPTGNALLIIDTTTGMVIPVGNISQRPGSPSMGTLRFNSESTRMEVYDGTEWDSVVSDVTNQVLYGDNSTLVFTLDQSTTAAAVLIMFNGVVQLPNVAYTVSGNVVTFAQAPAISDIIDVRFL